MARAGTMLAVLLALAITLTGCTLPELRKSTTVDLRISCDEFQQPGQQHQTRDVNFKTGSTLAVTLCANPTTGFQWEAPVISDSAVLALTDQRDLAPAASPGVVGAPGESQWTFAARQSGSTTVAFSYSRPWEGGEKGVWTLTLNVTVT